MVGVFLLVESRLAQASRWYCQPLLSQETGVVLHITPYSHSPGLLPSQIASLQRNWDRWWALWEAALKQDSTERPASWGGLCSPAVSRHGSPPQCHVCSCWWCDSVRSGPYLPVCHSIDQVAFDCLLTRTSKIFKLNLTHLGYIRPTGFR